MKNRSPNIEPCSIHLADMNLSSSVDHLLSQLFPFSSLIIYGLVSQKHYYQDRLNAQHIFTFNFYLNKLEFGTKSSG